MGSSKSFDKQAESFKKDLGCDDPEKWYQFINDKERGLSAVTKLLWKNIYNDETNVEYIKLLISIYKDASNNRELSESDLESIANQMHPK